MLNYTLKEKGVGAVHWIIAIILVGIIVGSAVYVIKPAPSEGEEREYPPAVLEWADMVREKYGGMTINVAADAHPAQEGLEALTAEFEELTGITVNWVVYDESMFFANIRVMATGEHVPFQLMYNCPELCPAFAADGLLVPIDDLIEDPEMTPEWHDTDDIIDALWPSATYEGEIYGVPIHSEESIVAYRKDLFDEYDKEPPTTYEELLELAKFFDGIPEVDYGMSIRSGPGWLSEWQWSTFAAGYGKGWWDAETKTPQFNTPETIESLKYMKELLIYGPGEEVWGHPDAWTKFGLGKAAILVEASACLDSLEDPEKSSVVGKIGYAPMPEGPAGRAVWIGAWNLAIPSVVTEKQREAAYTVIMWMTSGFRADEYFEESHQITRWSTLEKGAEPYSEAIKNSIELTKDNPYAKLISDFYMAPGHLDVIPLIGTYAHSAEIGEITVETACAELQEDAIEMMVP